MRPHEIERWALDIIDRVRSNRPIEDFRVELKSQWPKDPRKAARRIAGHANAARGEPILWLIGVDEENGLVKGESYIEFASWYNSVKAAFDEIAPEPISFNIPVNGVTVVALFFETDRAPFVIKAADGGAIQREVPWREATGVQSASRSQLIKMLSPRQKLPNIEVVGSILNALPSYSHESRLFLRWEICVALFITQPQEQETVILSHRSSCFIEIYKNVIITLIPEEIAFKECGWKNVSATQTGVSIKGSGMFEVRSSIASRPTEDRDDIFKRNAKLTLVFRPVNSEFSLPIAIEMTTYSVDKQKGVWRSGNHTFLNLN